MVWTLTVFEEPDTGFTGDVSIEVSMVGGSRGEACFPDNAQASSGGPQKKSGVAETASEIDAHFLSCGLQTDQIL
jgi:hypothetical protein